MNRRLDSASSTLEAPGSAAPLHAAPSEAEPSTPSHLAGTTSMQVGQAPAHATLPEEGILEAFEASGAPGPGQVEDPPMRIDLSNFPDDPRAIGAVLGPSQETNMDRFNRATGEVLGTLYKEFPLPVEREQLAGVVVKGQDLAMQAAFDATADWLMEEGFIRKSAPLNPQFHNAKDPYTLTTKGLAVMTTTPASLKEKNQSIGEALKGALKSGAKDGVVNLAKDAISAGAKIALGVATHHILR